MSNQWGHGYYSGLKEGARKKQYSLYKVTNGWKECPSCWGHYVMKPVRMVNHNADGLCAFAWRGYILRILGFSFFVEIST